MKRKSADRPLLIVDDNPVIVRLLGSMLAREGYQVVEAGGGREALDLLDSIQPELILLDIDMPGVSGLETCRALKANARTADIPVIFVTASDDKQDIVAGFAAGGQDYIVKPSTKEELLARVRTHLALCRSQQELKASRARYRDLSYRDDLTGFHNTRYLYKSLERQLEKHPDRPLAVVFIDIDRFKQVVDTHGHLNGSRAIAELAAVIKPLLPKEGFGVSYGGDEFVLVLPGCDGPAGRELAERFREAIAANHFLTAQDLCLRLTVSSGVAAYPEDARTMVDLLGNADHALFASKRLGRNTVVCFAAMPADPPPESFLNEGRR